MTDIDVSSIKNLLEIAHRLFKRGDTSAALTNYLAILTHDAMHAIALYNCGLCYRKLQRYEEAIISFEQLAQIQSHPKITHQLADLAFLQQQYPLAIAYYQTVLGYMTETSDYSLYFNLASSYFCLANYSMAEFYYQKVLFDCPNERDTLFNLGVIAQLNEAPQIALTYYQRVLQQNAQDLPTLTNSGVCLLKLEQHAQALQIYRQLVALDPTAAAAQFTLQALEHKTSPKPPIEYITQLFNPFAERYDKMMLENLAYQVPQWIGNMITTILNSAVTETVITLDLGCGTGLMGESLFKLAWSFELTGVDLSLPMLKIAQQKNCYQHLICADFLESLQPELTLFDIIIAADVFVYLGKLDTVLALCAKNLKAGGMLLFTTEKLVENLSNSSDQTYQIQATGRYAHSKIYLENLANQYGFQIHTLMEIPLRYQNGKKLSGFGAVYKRDI